MSQRGVRAIHKEKILRNCGRLLICVRIEIDGPERVNKKRIVDEYQSTGIFDVSGACAPSSVVGS